MLSAFGLRELLEQVLLSRDPTTLYTICHHALQMTGARNAMIADFSVEHGYMILRAGKGQDWTPEMLGSQIAVGDDQRVGITAYVAATGKAYRSDDVTEERRYRLLIQGTRSELAAPIRDRHARVRGVLNVESDEVAKFGEDEQKVLELLAVIAGITLEGEDQRFREEALLEVVTALDVAQTEEDLLRRVALVTQSTMRVSAYSIFLWDEEQQAFALRDTVGSSTLAKDAKYLPGEGCTGWVCENGEPVRLHEPLNDARWRGKYLEFPLEEIRSFIAVPILSGGRCMGCMRALRKKPGNSYIDNRFTDDDERLLMAIAEQLGTGLEKIRNLKKLLGSERMAAWGELSAKSSHIIGNRVFALKGDLNELKHLLNEQQLSREKTLEVVESLTAGVNRLDEILQEYRDFVTATKLSSEETDLNEVLENSAKALIPVSSPVSIRFELSKDLPKLILDGKKIERAVSELIENALHFVEKGQIMVRSRLANPDDLRAANITARHSQYALIEIEDQGPGVADESKAKIFEPYQSTRPRGMGLGLSIVKGIIEAHSGKVYEAGEPGKGARFVILLPIKA